MRLLALDTATRATVAAFCDGERMAEARDDPPPGARPGHAEHLLALAAQALGVAGADWAQLEAIVVGRGPGTFTGLRIGIATARGLASSLGVPLVGVSTLESLAQPALDAGEGPVASVIDARRREVFAAVWTADGACLDGPQVVRPDALAERLAALPGARAVGDGAVEWRQVLEPSGAIVPPDGSELHRVSAVAHCRLARDAPAARPQDIRPEYLRVPDAELARRATPDASA